MIGESGIAESESVAVAKVVYKSLRTGRFAKSAPRSVGKKRVVTATGGRKTVRTLDANSASFDSDLHYVFSQNVAKARRENKRLFGSADIGPRKG
jgi:hypothetical protein